MPIVGNTVTISANFPSTIPNLDSMTNVKLNVYTSDFNLLYTVSEATKVSTGNYTLNYTVSNKLMPSPLILEVSGTVGGFDYIGRTQLNRSLV